MKSKCVLQNWDGEWIGRLIHITCLLGRVLFVVRLIPFFLSHHLKWQLLRSKNQECRVVDFLWLNCSWLLSPLMLHNGFITHFTKYRLLQTKNKITSVKHWHCSMICLWTTTTTTKNEYARKKMHLFGAFWLDSWLATEFNTFGSVWNIMHEFILNSVCIMNATTVSRSHRQHVVHKSNMVKLALRMVNKTKLEKCKNINKI